MCQDMRDDDSDDDSDSEDLTDDCVVNHGSLQMFEYVANCLNIFSINSKLWKDQKLRRIILLHGELVVFNFHLPKNPNVFISRFCWEQWK